MPMHYVQLKSRKVFLGFSEPSKGGHACFMYIALNVLISYITEAELITAIPVVDSSRFLKERVASFKSESHL